mmetsp:Transcript_31865/g.82485  ORF Transcript_31865/g.82485 Transcript_31865/m.82485 type:complete len:488 (+) Transcript_31865:196-1659(+)
MQRSETSAALPSCGRRLFVLQFELARVSYWVGTGSISKGCGASGAAAHEAPAPRLRRRLAPVEHRQLPSAARRPRRLPVHAPLHHRAVPRHGHQHGQARVPAAVAHRVVVVLQDRHALAGEQVVDVDAALVGAGVDEALPRGDGGREVAADEGADDAVAVVRLEAHVLRVAHVVAARRVIHPAVVPPAKPRKVRWHRQPPVVRVAVHLAHVPQLDGLVFAVGDEVPSVALGVDVRDALGVSHKHALRPPARGYAALVPQLAELVVAAGEDEVGGFVQESNSVDVVVVPVDVQAGLLLLHVVDDHGVVVGARHQLPAVRRPPDGPDAKAAVRAAVVEVHLLVDVGDVGDRVEPVAAAAHIDHMHAGRDGGVDEQPLVGRQAGVGDRPAQVARDDVLAQLEVVAHVVEADLVLLGSGDEDGAVARELANVGAPAELLHDAAGLGGHEAVGDMAALRGAHALPRHARLAPGQHAGQVVAPLGGRPAGRAR